MGKLGGGGERGGGIGWGAFGGLSGGGGVKYGGFEESEGGGKDDGLGDYRAGI